MWRSKTVLNVKELIKIILYVSLFISGFFSHLNLFTYHVYIESNCPLTFILRADSKLAYVISLQISNFYNFQVKFIYRQG